MKRPELDTPRRRRKLERRRKRRQLEVSPKIHTGTAKKLLVAVVLCILFIGIGAYCDEGGWKWNLGKTWILAGLAVFWYIEKLFDKSKQAVAKAK